MAKKQRQSRFRKLLGFVYVAISFILIYTLVVRAQRVIEQKKEYNTLVEQRDSLLKEKKALSQEVELLNDDDYVVRYARENYIFSKDGEEVIKLPELKK